jgi:hypothetical protein
MNLAARSTFIDVRPIEMQPGWPPEKYIITYTCRGIASIDLDELPRVSEFHQVSMYMGSEYPLKEPYLRWLTPIWHPNIAHEEPHHVCTNNVQNWFAAKPLAELVLAMGEMVQYKHYHAKWIAPYPLDRDAADWVLEFAEPRGILGPNKPFDDRPLLQTQRMRKTSPSPAAVIATQAKKGVKLGRVPAKERLLKNDAIEGKAGERSGTSSAHSHEPNPAGKIVFGIRRKEGKNENIIETTAERTTRPLKPISIGSSDNSSPTLTLYAIEILREGKLQRIEKVEKPVISIGRGALGTSVDLVLEGDQTMSRLHAIIERDEGGAFWLTAKGTNPVLVGGRVVPRDRSIAVDVGQMIEICSYCIKLQ